MVIVGWSLFVVRLRTACLLPNVRLPDTQSIEDEDSGQSVCTCRSFGNVTTTSLKGPAELAVTRTCGYPPSSLAARPRMRNKRKTLLVT